MKILNVTAALLAISLAAVLGGCGDDAPDLGHGVSAGPAAAPAELPHPTYEGYTLVESPQVVAPAALVVGGAVLTVEDILQPIAGRLEAISDATEGEAAFQRQAAELIAGEIRRQFEEALVYQQAQAQMNEQTEAQVAAQVAARIRSEVLQDGTTDAAYIEKLRQRGISLAERREQIRREMVNQAFLQQKFGAELNVTRDQLWRYYQANQDRYSSPKRVQMQILALPWAEFLPEGTTERNPAAMEQARQAARQAAGAALAESRAGADFDEVVTRFSRGPLATRAGVRDFMEAGNLRYQAVERAAFAMEAGQISDVIEEEGVGLFIVKARGVEPARVAAFGEVQPEIERALRTEQYQRLAENYRRELAEKLRHVETLPFAISAVEVAFQRYYRR